MDMEISLVHNVKTENYEKMKTIISNSFKLFKGSYNCMVERQRCILCRLVQLQHPDAIQLLLWTQEICYPKCHLSQIQNNQFRPNFRPV